MDLILSANPAYDLGERIGASIAGPFVALILLLILIVGIREQRRANRRWRDRPRADRG